MMHTFGTSPKLALALAVVLFWCAMSGWGAVATQSSAQPESITLPIIMYHSTHPRNPNTYSVTPAQLESDLQYLVEQGFRSVTVRDLIDFQDNGTALPARPIMLTFDDGYVNNYLYAFPLLCKYQMPAVFSIVGRYTDDNYDKEGNLHATNSHMTYEQILEVHNSGMVEIQNHTYNLHTITRERKAMARPMHESPARYEQFIKEDLTKMQTRLLQHTGIACTAVTFPFGRYSAETVNIIRKLGYRASFTCTVGTNHITRTSDLMLLKRVNRPSGRSIERCLPTVVKAGGSTRVY